jgi:hypothetical protein
MYCLVSLRVMSLCDYECVIKVDPPAKFIGFYTKNELNVNCNMYKS